MLEVPTIEISSATGEYSLPSGRVRRDVSFKADERFSYADLQACGRHFLGMNCKVFNTDYAIDSFRVEGDIIHFAFSRESDETKRRLEFEAKQRQLALEQEIARGLEHLLNSNTSEFSKMLASETIAAKSASRFGNL